MIATALRSLAFASEGRSYPTSSRSYLAFGLPVVFAGFVIPHIGLQATVFGYGATIACMVAVVGLWRRFRATD